MLYRAGLQIQEQPRPAAAQSGGVISLDSDEDEGSATAAEPPRKSSRMTAVKQVAAKAPPVQPCPTPAKAAAPPPGLAAELEALQRRCAVLQAQLAGGAAAANPATPAVEKAVFTPQAKPGEKPAGDLAAGATPPVPCAPPTSPPSTVSSGPSASTASPAGEAYAATEPAASPSGPVDEAALSEQLDLSAPESCPICLVGIVFFDGRQVCNF